MEGSTFFAWINRMPLIQRWGLMYSVRPENIAAHSFQVAVITQHLVSIKNNAFGGNLDPNVAVTYALYHEVSETKMLDTPTPVKYSDPEFTKAIKKLEHKTEIQCIETLPDELQSSFRKFVVQKEADPEYKKIVKAADTIAAYIKTLTELKFHNREYIHVKENLEEALSPMVKTMPEVKEFLNIFVAPSIASLDLSNMGISTGRQNNRTPLDSNLKAAIIEQMFENKPEIKEFLNIFIASSVDNLDLSNMDLDQDYSQQNTLGQNHKVAINHMLDSRPEVKNFLETFLDDLGSLALNNTKQTHKKISLEHSHKVAVIAHILAVLNNKMYPGNINPEKAAGCALQYEMSKSMNVSDNNPDSTAVLLALQQALSANMLEGLASSQEIKMMPKYLKDSLIENLSQNETDKKYQNIVEAADMLAQYIESLNKIRFHNRDCSKSMQALEKALEPLKEKMPEVKMVLEAFVPSCTATIDQITRKPNMLLKQITEAEENQDLGPRR